MTVNLHVRVDSRLLHGQVVQFWLGHLEITHLIIADDEVAKTEAMAAIYRMALPEAVVLTVIPVQQLCAELMRHESSSTMILVREVDDAAQTLMTVGATDRLTLGNVHMASDRARVTDSVYLSDAQISQLVRLTEHGIAVEIQTFPGEILRLVSNGEGGAEWSRP